MSPAFMLCLSLAAAPSAGLVVAKRNGVSRTVAQTRAEVVRSALGEAFSSAPIDDLTSCNGKRPCLVREARQRGWVALLVIETATVLSDPLVNVVLLSVDDDGRELERVTLQAPGAELAAKLVPALEPLRARLTMLVTPPLTQPASAQVQPAAAPALPVEPKPIEPVPAPPPAVVREMPPQKPLARWAPAAAGLVALGVGVGFTVASRSLAAQLASDIFPNEDVPRALASKGQAFEAIGASLLMGGGAVALGGLVLALLWPEAHLAPVAVVSERGGLFGVAGRWP